MMIEHYSNDDTIDDALVEALLKGSKEPMEVFSYHYYNGVSERIAADITLLIFLLGTKNM